MTTDIGPASEPEVAEDSNPADRFFQVSQTITVDLLLRNILHNGVSIPFSGHPGKLLIYFARNAGKIISRREIVETAFGLPYNTNIAAGALNRLQKHLDKLEPGAGSRIQNRAGLGYTFISYADDPSVEATAKKAEPKASVGKTGGRPRKPKTTLTVLKATQPAIAAETQVEPEALPAHEETTLEIPHETETGPVIAEFEPLVIQEAPHETQVELSIAKPTADTTFEPAAIQEIAAEPPHEIETELAVAELTAAEPVEDDTTSEPPVIQEAAAEITATASPAKTKASKANTLPKPHKIKGLHITLSEAGNVAEQTAQLSFQASRYQKGRTVTLTPLETYIFNKLYEINQPREIESFQRLDEPTKDILANLRSLAEKLRNISGQTITVQMAGKGYCELLVATPPPLEETPDEDDARARLTQAIVAKHNGPKKNNAA